MNSHLAHTPAPCRITCVLLPLLLLAWLLLIPIDNAVAAADSPAENGPAVVATQPAPSHNLADARPAPSLAIATAKALGALAVVLGLLMLLAAALKKLGLSGQSPQGDGLIKVLETRMLGPKKYVAVLDIAGQTMAVGITDQQITLLTRLEPDEKMLALARQRPTSSRFASLLSRAVNNKNNIAQKDHA